MQAVSTKVLLEKYFINFAHSIFRTHLYVNRDRHNSETTYSTHYEMRNFSLAHCRPLLVARTGFCGMFPFYLRRRASGIAS